MIEPAKETTEATAQPVTQSISASLHFYPWGVASVVLAGLLLTAAVRYSLLDFKSLDFYASLKPWYNTIKSQGFPAFATAFSTYNPPYLYLLYLIARFLPETPIVIAVKLPALVADYICGVFVYLIVQLRFERKPTLPILAAMAMLFAPSIVLNSAFWGQAESLFTAGLLACVYFLMIRRSGPAMLCFGIALAFKLQSIFLVPALLAFGLKGLIRWRYFVVVPAILLLALLPSLVAGRPLGELVGVYAYQATQFEFITMNAPSIYAWLPGTKQVFNLFYVPGVILGTAAAFLLCLMLFRSPRALTAPLVLEIALVTMLIIPFFLPKMHERYFYPADILSIAFAFFYPQLFIIPILVGGVSFLAYQPFLFERDLVALPILTLLLLGVIGVLFHHLMRQLYSPVTGKTKEPKIEAKVGLPIPVSLEDPPQ